jgi:uncharacterized small protein (DUF1192 family)
MGDNYLEVFTRPYYPAKASPDIDSQFIFHAREDIPALLAEVERLRAEVEQLRAEPMSVQRRKVIQLEAEVERLRAALRAKQEEFLMWRSSFGV